MDDDTPITATPIITAANGDHEWSSQSGAICQACGFAGNAGDFSTEDAP